MNKIVVLMLALGLLATTDSQGQYKKKPALAVQFVLSDYKTPVEIRTKGLSSVIKSKSYAKGGRMSPGLAISYIEGLGEHIDFAGTISGTYEDYPVPTVGAPIAADRLQLQVAATANLKLMTDKYWFTPFLTAGVGANKFRSYYSAFLPLGVGLQVNVLDEAYILVNSQYRVPVTENAVYQLYHSIGIAGNIFKRKAAAEPAPVALPVVEKPADRDGDGIVDAEDKCPDVKGIASLAGCPDADGDGITDGDDQCPNVAGTAKYKGCPIPDTDKDGINDEEDKCVSVAGVARYQGCPVPDTDKDGINDEEDKCIDKAGPASNQGCPEIAKAVIDKINYAAKNVFFATGSAKLLAKSYKPLNEVAKLMVADPSLKLAIDGHTDNAGKADKNQVLSQNRANAVMAYLKSKGVTEDRMTATGYGQDQPVADNKTAAGKAKNRRVEMKASNY